MYPRYNVARARYLPFFPPFYAACWIIRGYLIFRFLFVSERVCNANCATCAQRVEWDNWNYFFSIEGSLLLFLISPFERIKIIGDLFHRSIEMLKLLPFFFDRRKGKEWIEVVIFRYCHYSKVKQYCYFIFLFFFLRVKIYTFIIRFIVRFIACCHY